MKIVVPLGELTRKLNAISSVVPAKTTMPVLSTVLVDAGDDGIRFSATDLDISVTSRVSGTVEEAGRIAAPAKKLAEIVKSLTGDVVTLSVSEGKLTVTCGRSRFVVNGRNADDFPKLPQQESAAYFSIDPSLLNRLVLKTIHAVSSDLTRPALCGVLWDVDRQGITMVSTDGHRLSRVTLKLDLGKIEKQNVIVPPKALTTLRSYSEGEEQITVRIGENSISFEMEESSIYSRLLEGPFPSYEKVIPTKNDKELVVGREKLGAATRRVSILSDALTHQVVFAIDKDRVKLHVTTQELGEATEEIDANYGGEAMEIGYNASYIQDILKTINSDDVIFKLDRPDNAGIIEPAAPEENVEQLCIVMPLRIS